MASSLGFGAEARKKKGTSCTLTPLTIVFFWLTMKELGGMEKGKQRFGILWPADHGLNNREYPALEPPVRLGACGFALVSLLVW